MEKLLNFLAELRDRKIHFTLHHIRDETVMVDVSVPGERWEVEFLADGSVEIEIFRSNGDILGSEAIETLLAKCSD